MGSNNIAGKLAYFSARRRWTVLGVWLVVLVAAFFVAGGIGDATSNDGSSGSNLESSIGSALVDERINADEPSKEFVLVLSALCFCR